MCGAVLAMVPCEVLQRVQCELTSGKVWRSSDMEMSHRGKEFISIAQQAEADLREVAGIPANYKVLFMQGGATGQFTFVPMNLLRGKQSIDVVLTGDWGKKADKEDRTSTRMSSSHSCASRLPSSA